MLTGGHSSSAAHQWWPVWAPSVDENNDPHHYVKNCAGCGDTAPDAEDSVAWFAGHLKELGAPDYMVTYWNDWADHVEAPTGAVTRDAVARDLFDFGVVMGEVIKVYSELAELSKPNTAAHHIINAANERFAAQYADYLCDHISGFVDDGQDTVSLGELREIAEGWHAGSWAEHVAGRALLDEMLAARAADGQESS